MRNHTLIILFRNQNIFCEYLKKNHFINEPPKSMKIVTIIFSINCKVRLSANPCMVMNDILVRVHHIADMIGNCMRIGEAPITQLRTCVIKIVTFKGGHLMW